MSDKFELYDLLGVLIPGSLMLAAGCVAFPQTVTVFATARFPQTFTVLCLIATATFLGHLVQAVTSFLEPLIYKSWGGRPSERALREGLGTRYFPAEDGARIKGKLARIVGNAASDRSLFLYAMQHAETSGNSRVAKFNGLFAYHRAMLTLTLVVLLVFLTSMRWGTATQWPRNQKVELIVLVVILLVIFWFRAKQRAFYYVREVLSTTERLIDQSAERGVTR